MMRPMMSMPNGMCQFCLSNGENLEQCRSHQLKSSTGLVSCPILRTFTCPLVSFSENCFSALSYFMLTNCLPTAIISVF